MVSVYDRIFPACFPYMAVLELPEIALCVQKLLQTDARLPWGSSFAVTTSFNQPKGTQQLWLSKASADRISQLVPEIRFQESEALKHE